MGYGWGMRLPALALLLTGVPASACDFHAYGFAGMAGMGGFGHAMIDGASDEAAPAPLPPPTRAEALAALRAQLLARTPALLAGAGDQPPETATPPSSGVRDQAFE